MSASPSAEAYICVVSIEPGRRRAGPVGRKAPTHVKLQSLWLGAMNRPKSAIAVSLLAMLLLVVAGLALWIGPAWWRQRQWFALQSQQLATIDQFESLPPSGWSRDGWRNAIVTLHNVWGNVTYHPSYSEISNTEMRELQSKLDRILRETTPDNSMDSVDRVFGLLMDRGKKTRFVSGYREEFRTFRDDTEHRSNASSQSPALDPATGQDADE